MRRNSTQFIVVLCTFLIGIVAVFLYSIISTHRAESMKDQFINDNPSQANATSSTKPQTICDGTDPYETILKVASLKYPQVKSLRSIDFANFIYPEAVIDEKDSRDPGARFKLRDGKVGDWRVGYALEEVTYGDVTGDGLEEAMANIHEMSDGSGAWSRAYVFTLEDHRPKVLWAFKSGDRANGGLVRLYADKSELVIELFGMGTCIGGNMSDKDFNGLALPKWITRTYYQWSGSSFMPVGEMEIMANPVAKTNCPTCYTK